MSQYACHAELKSHLLTYQGAKRLKAKRPGANW